MSRSGPERPWRPTRDQVAAAHGATVPDVAGPGLRVLFVGINPGLYSGAVGHHFARPGNRFWKALHGAGLTGRPLGPFEEHRLLDAGLGITNLVERATAGADELSADELREGGLRLREKVERLRPEVVAFLGLSAFRTAFDRRSATVGPQPERIGRSRVWLLPNPSGLNAHYQLPDLVAAYGALAEAAPPHGRARREGSSG
jgi:double-stranded uracil-DNA glycosylase